MASSEPHRVSLVGSFAKVRAPRWACGVLALGWLAVGFWVWFYATGFVRGALGDVAVVAFIAHLVGIAWNGPIGVRAGGALLFAFAIECSQLLGAVEPDSPWWMHLFLGSTFDPWDLVHYTVSAILAVLAELFAFAAVLRSGAGGRSEAAD